LIGKVIAMRGAKDARHHAKNAIGDGKQSSRSLRRINLPADRFHRWTRQATEP